jgi:hypothetical protein
MAIVLVKDGVKFEATVGPYIGKIAPGGFALLAAIQGAADALGRDVTISSGSDGCHSGVNDPHHRAEAYDIRTHDIPDKGALLQEIQNRLPVGRFYVFIEALNTENEHIHGQVRKGTTYP